MKGTMRDLGMDKTRLVSNLYRTCDSRLGCIDRVTLGQSLMTAIEGDHLMKGAGRELGMDKTRLVRNLYRTQLGDSDQLVR